jgi:hypothetical protein
MRPVTTLLLALVLFACGASARERAISTALVATNATRDGFIAFDARHQQQLVDSATSLEEGRARIDAYRRQREPIVQGFATVYRAIAMAAVLTDDPTAIPNLLRAADLLRTAIHDLTGGKLP